MSSLAGGVWSILSTYRPWAARSGPAPPKRFGAFKAVYRPPKSAVLRPQTDKDAQALYNHIRTVAFYMDAAPLLTDLGLPFRAGLDDIISLVPIWGDLVSGILQLYQVWLSFVFGAPLNVLGYMLLNVFLDVVAGIIPIIGDIIDNLFKANLRNLALLEEWLLTSPVAQQKYHILLMPETTDFIPKAKSPSRVSTWFGGSGVDSAEASARAEESRTGRVRKTRRMGRDEVTWEVPVGTAPVGTAPVANGFPAAAEPPTPPPGLGTGSGLNGSVKYEAPPAYTRAPSDSIPTSTRSRSTRLGGPIATSRRGLQ